MQRMDLGRVITDLLRSEGITQQELANRAGVSQATVSRALARRGVRHGPARTRLFVYMQEHTAKRRSESGDPVGDALAEAWDGSQEHAHALAKLILASRELWPTLGEERNR